MKLAPPGSLPTCPEYPMISFDMRLMSPHRVGPITRGGTMTVSLTHTGYLTCQVGDSIAVTEAPIPLGRWTHVEATRGRITARPTTNPIWEPA